LGWTGLAAWLDWARGLDWTEQLALHLADTTGDHFFDQKYGGKVLV